MKLLGKQEATSLRKQRNDALIDESLRLNGVYKTVKSKLDTIKDNYDPEKLRAMADFEAFCKDLDQKKSKKLKELVAIEAIIEEKKELYYGLIAKQDALDERIYQIGERENKVELREKFISELEAKWKTRTSPPTTPSTPT